MSSAKIKWKRHTWFSESVPAGESESCSHTMAMPRGWATCAETLAEARIFYCKPAPACAECLSAPLNSTGQGGRMCSDRNRSLVHCPGWGAPPQRQMWRNGQQCPQSHSIQQNCTVLVSCAHLPGLSGSCNRGRRFKACLNYSMSSRPSWENQETLVSK